MEFLEGHRPAEDFRGGDRPAELDGFYGEHSPAELDEFDGGDRP